MNPQGSRPFCISPFDTRYQEQVVELILGIQRDEFRFSITKEEQPDLLAIPEYYQSNRGNFWIALEPRMDSVIGTIGLLDVGESYGALRKMFVHPSWRGREHGVGYALLATLLSWAKQQKLRAVYLGTTESFVAAHRFYEKNGFASITPDELPKTFPRMSLDTRFYRKLL